LIPRDEEEKRERKREDGGHEDMQGSGVVGEGTS
jgi:hypothetical protein